MSPSTSVTATSSTFLLPLAAAAALISVPIIIHLINRMRYKRVRWAAMEFLLASYKKHRRWVWLKQLLLMLSRIAIIAPMGNPR